MHLLPILVPLALFFIGQIMIGHKEGKEESKLSLEDCGRLSKATSKVRLWRLLPIISIIAVIQLFKVLPQGNHLLIEALSFVLTIVVTFGISTFFRFQSLAKEGVPESYIQAMKSYAKARFVMFLILPVLVFIIAMLPLLWAIVINFFHPHAH
jgi:hypothetical protein